MECTLNVPPAWTTPVSVCTLDDTPTKTHARISGCGLPVERTLHVRSRSGDTGHPRMQPQEIAAAAAALSLTDVAVLCTNIRALTVRRGASHLGVSSESQRCNALTRRDVTTCDRAPHWLRRSFSSLLVFDCWVVYTTVQFRRAGCTIDGLPSHRSS